MKFDGGISLISFNPAYPPMIFTNEQIEKMPVKIIGRVVENRQKY
jgi:repressor LexA